MTRLFILFMRVLVAVALANSAATLTAQEDRFPWGLRKAVLQSDRLLLVTRRPSTKRYELCRVQIADGHAHYDKLLRYRGPPDYAGHLAPRACSWDVDRNVLWLSTIESFFTQQDCHMVHRCDIDAIDKYARLNEARRIAIQNGEQPPSIIDRDSINFVYIPWYGTHPWQPNYGAAIEARDPTSFFLIRLGTVHRINTPPSEKPSLEIVPFIPPGPKKKVEEQTAECKRCEDWPFELAFQTVLAGQQRFFITEEGQLFELRNEENGDYRLEQVKIRGGELIQYLIRDDDRRVTFGFTSNYWFEITRTPHFHDFTSPTFDDENPVAAIMPSAREIRRHFPAVPTENGLTR